MDAFKDLLHAIGDNKFYFGIGGMGDFLLLMSTFYDNIEANTEVVFVCNNVNTAKEMSKEFPLVSRWWFFPRKAFNMSPDTWKNITSKHCHGTGVTPANFDYVNEWIKCGQHPKGVFGYYGVDPRPYWAKNIISNDPPHITIQPQGGKDSNRISRINNEDLTKLVSDCNDHGYRVFLIGSNSDIQNIGVIPGSSWVVNFEDSLRIIKGAIAHIGVNSWVKTMSGLIGIPTYIWKSEYIRPPKEVFGVDYDPSDTVFLSPGWGFHDVNDLKFEDLK